MSALKNTLANPLDGESQPLTLLGRKL